MKSVKATKIKDFILHNIWLKILSVILAVFIWIIIVNVDNPSRTKTISGIDVILLNENSLTDKGYTYAIQSGSTISITVKAPQSVVDSLEASDFYAYADLNETSLVSDSAEIKVRCEKAEVANQVDIVSMKTEHVKLLIDNKTSKDLPLELRYEGQPAEGYVVGDCYVSPATVNVTGAEKTVNSIAKIIAHYDISNMAHSVTEEVTLRFYDAEGKEVKTDLLELSRKRAQININILPTKWVDIKYTLNGNPAEGYVITDKTASFDKICLAATKEKLDAITSIDLPLDTININGISEDKSYEVALRTFIPSGYRIVSSDVNMDVQIKVSRRVGIRIPYENIELKGAKDLYDYDIVRNPQGITIYAIGNKDVVEKLTISDFYPTVSVAGKNIGKHTIKIDLNPVNEKDYELEQDVYLDVNVMEKPTEPETEEPETSEPETTEDNKAEAQRADAGTDIDTETTTTTVSTEIISM